MTEKISNILFHPSKLVEYRFTKLYKVLLYLLILSTFSITVLLIDTIKSPGLTLQDKPLIENIIDFDFSVAKTLPDCVLDNNKFTCDENSDQKEIGKVFRLFTIVSDVNNSMNNDIGRYVIKFTNDSVKVVNGNYEYFDIKYNELPSKWQEFDFKQIRNSNDPENQLYILFLGGFNQILRLILPLNVIFLIGFSFVFNIIQILFYSLLFLLFFRNFNVKYMQLFKITVFAHTFPVVLGVILDLLRINQITSFIVTTLTFIYVYIALISNMPKESQQI